MNFFNKRVRAVYRKELMEILRDRRTLTAMIVVPIALYPLLMVVFANAAGEQTSKIVGETFIIGVKTDRECNILRQILERDYLALRQEQGLPPPEPNTFVHDLPQQPEGSLIDTSCYVVPDGDLEKTVREQKIHAGVEILPQKESGNSTGQIPIRIFALDEWIRSRAAAVRLFSMAERINDRERPNLIEVTSVSLTNETSILSVILPLILILMTITGAIYPAIDLTAGERERGTLESLMVCPVPVRDLICGKFLVVTTVAIGGAALNLASVSATVYFGGFAGLIQKPNEYTTTVTTVTSDEPAEQVPVTPTAEKPVPARPRIGGQFPWYVLPIILVALIPFALLMSAIMLAVSASARTFKEAQNYVTPVILGVLLPGGVAALPGTELGGTNLVMPVANMVLLTRDLLREPTVVPLASIAWVLLSTTLYAVAAIAVATRVFGNEAVVFSDSGSIKTLFMRKFMKPRDYPNRTTAWLILALLLPIWFYVQNGLNLANPEDIAALLRGTAVLMPIFFVVIPALALFYWRVDLFKTFGLRIPRFTDLLAGVLIGVSAWIPTHELFLWMKEVFGVPPSLAQFDELFQIGLSQFSPFVALLMVAILPGLCEELLFRGMMLHSLRTSVNRWMAIALTAAVFGAFHMSFFRFPITFGLGLAFGFLCWQSRSVWPAIVAHVLHNGLGVSQTLWPGWLGRVYPRLADDSAHLPLEVILVGVVVLILAFALIWRGRRADGVPNSLA